MTTAQEEKKYELPLGRGLNWTYIENLEADVHTLHNLIKMMKTKTHFSTIEGMKEEAKEIMKKDQTTGIILNNYFQDKLDQLKRGEGYIGSKIKRGEQ